MRLTALALFLLITLSCPGLKAQVRNHAGFTEGGVEGLHEYFKKNMRIKRLDLDRDFHGAMIFDAGGHNQRGNRDIPDGPLFGSDPWNELFVFALDEARRLDLEMGFNIQSGWARF